LDDFPLQGGETGILIQQLFGDEKLSDVVAEKSERNLLELALRIHRNIILDIAQAEQANIERMGVRLGARPGQPEQGKRGLPILLDQAERLFRDGEDQRRDFAPLLGNPPEHFCQAFRRVREKQRNLLFGVLLAIGENVVERPLGLGGVGAVVLRLDVNDPARKLLNLPPLGTAELIPLGNEQGKRTRRFRFHVNRKRNASKQLDHFQLNGSKLVGLGNRLGFNLRRRGLQRNLLGVRLLLR
jgi:hypothetical protein